MVKVMQMLPDPWREYLGLYWFDDLPRTEERRARLLARIDGRLAQPEQPEQPEPDAAPAEESPPGPPTVHP